MNDPSAAEVLRVEQIGNEVVADLLSRYGLQCNLCGPGDRIPGSYWGESEAGLIGETVFYRADTPVHSLLHETAHAVCMDRPRRTNLIRDAGGDDQEENAVCYLQVLLADEFAAMGRLRMWCDMDAWGYTFRLGGAQRWFEQDAADARQWLVQHGLIDANERVLWRMRDDARGSASPQSALSACSAVSFLVEREVEPQRSQSTQREERYRYALAQAKCVRSAVAGTPDPRSDESAQRF